MIDSLFKVLAAGIGLWESKEKNRYKDELIELERAYYEEFNKDDGTRSDAALDDIQFRLRLLSTNFVDAASTVRASDT